ncbi:hypothetical protein M758_12G189100 [Ceratodon purpureus]|uniref:Uncharacterized protein n=1 Tax=Ceratodon purpureus TaxID=3225 RepID=A0A8T0GCA0_CERPU|nr:hypothetical protein KC19_12G185300 [Ceratodon purpureus]KAG0599936.1 hypothetical protein M758_12G189100 [Ceratodon purpureus]
MQYVFSWRSWCLLSLIFDFQYSTLHLGRCCTCFNTVPVSADSYLYRRSSYVE